MVNNSGKKAAADAVASEDLRWMLVTGSYTPDADHNTVSDVVANEISATGYARQTQAGSATTQNDTSDRAEMDHDDVTFNITEASVGFRYAIRYIHDAGGDSDSVIVDTFDLGAQTTSGVAVVLRPGATGSLHFS